MEKELSRLGAQSSSIKGGPELRVVARETLGNVGKTLGNLGNPWKPIGRTLETPWKTLGEPWNRPAADFWMTAAGGGLTHCPTAHQRGSQQTLVCPSLIEDEAVPPSALHPRLTQLILQPGQSGTCGFQCGRRVGCLLLHLHQFGLAGFGLTWLDN
eukprot:gene14183-biopygen139